MAPPGRAALPTWRPRSTKAGHTERSAEQAAHVVDILEAAAISMAADGRAVEVDSTFTPPARHAVGHGSAGWLTEGHVLGAE